MVERAAGRTHGQGPRPPQSFLWAGPLQNPAPDLASSALQFPASGRTVPLRPVLHRAPSGAESVSPVVSQDVAAVSGEKDDSTTPRVLQNSFGDDTHPPLISRPTTLVSERPSTSSQPTQVAARSNDIDRTALTAPDIETEEPALAMEAPMTVVNDSPILTATPVPRRRNFRTGAEGRARGESPRLTEAVEPVVEISIGSVEVRLDVPSPPAPKLVSRPHGFAEFEALRRYTAGPWPPRRR
jgi:hypothetical protein